jgi:hypothetical protein
MFKTNIRPGTGGQKDFLEMAYGKTDFFPSSNLKLKLKLKYYQLDIQNNVMVELNMVTEHVCKCLPQFV